MDFPAKFGVQRIFIIFAVILGSLLPVVTVLWIFDPIDVVEFIVELIMKLTVEHLLAVGAISLAIDVVVLLVVGVIQRHRLMDVRSSRRPRNDAARRTDPSWANLPAAASIPEAAD